MPNLPRIDPRIEHVGLTRLRSLSAANLRQQKNVLVIRDGEEPLAVMVPYAEYMRIQGMLDKVLEGGDDRF